MPEFTKTEWFPKSIKPLRPGMYMIRSEFTLPRNSWWAFDGANWHFGIATYSQMCQEIPCPEFSLFVKHPTVPENVAFEWCGMLIV